MNQPPKNQAAPRKYDPQRPASPMFRDLSDEEAAEFRAWARADYKPGTPINPVWHPVVREECNKINFESLSKQVDRVLDKVIDCNVAID